MSASAAALPAEAYEERKRFLDELKGLSKEEMEDIYRLLRESKAEYVENSNGVFFDVCKLSVDTFESLKKYLEFCRKNRAEFAEREEAERKAEEALGTWSAVTRRN